MYICSAVGTAASAAECTPAFPARGAPSRGHFHSHRTDLNGFCRWNTFSITELAATIRLEFIPVSK